MEASEALRLLSYRDMQIDWAERALEYATRQRLYILGKMAVATTETPQLTLIEGGLDV